MALALDTDGDIALGSAGIPHFIGGADEAIQRMGVRFRFVRGEWYRDTRLGIPYFEHVLLKRPRLQLVRSLFRQTILGVPGIERLERLTESFDRAIRTLKPEFAAVHQDGTVITDRDVEASLLPLEVS